MGFYEDLFTEKVEAEFNKKLQDELARNTREVTREVTKKKDAEINKLRHAIEEKDAEIERLKGVASPRKQ